MARTAKTDKPDKRYRFILNPYIDARFTRCPSCEGKMGQRKLPLVIHVEPLNPVILNKTCRYCVRCDLLIAHQDEIEALLRALFASRRPPLTDKDYLVIGTMDRADWRRGTKELLPVQDLPKLLHEFKEVCTVKPVGGWVRRDRE